MTSVKSILGMKDAPAQEFRNPERQSIEQTEDYAVKKSIQTKELIVGPKIGAGTKTLTYDGLTAIGAGGNNSKTLISLYNPDDGAGHAGAQVYLSSQGWGEWSFGVGNPATASTRMFYAAGGYIIYKGSTNGFLWIDTSGNNLANLSNTGSLGIGAIPPDANLKLDVVSTTKGARLPCMTTAQKNTLGAIPCPEGTEVYDLTLHKKCIWTGAAWETITSA